MKRREDRRIREEKLFVAAVARLITHNKITMEQSNGLHGVTIQKQGVSKIVSVKLDAIEEMPQAASA